MSDSRAGRGGGNPPYDDSGDIHGFGDPSSFPPPKNYAMSGKIMLSSIVVLFTVVILILCLHVYARWYLLRRARLRRFNRRRFVLSADQRGNNPASAATNRGLDPDLVKSLPVFTYSLATAAAAEPLECAVCLSEFQQSEKGRTLPECRHSFHIKCIDMWFYSHATCPLCRATVEPPEPRLPVSEPAHLVVEVSPEPSDLCDSCRHEERGAAAPCSSSTPLAPSSSGSAGVGGGGIRIDVPPRRGGEVMRILEEEVGSLGGVQGFKSPGGRMMSLKRILSIDLRFYRGGGAASPEHADLERGVGVGGVEAEERTPRTPVPQS